jgi:3-oxoacyl-[acyl-carrier-protein] synthase-1
MGCWLGLPESRGGVIGNDIGNACSAAFTTLGLPAAQALPRGNAAGLMALQIAAQRIAMGDIDLALAAGVDSYQDAQTLMSLDDSGWLMSGMNRNGFPPGEGAGACLLASRSAAKRLGLPLLGVVSAASTAVEPISIHSIEGVCIGAGLTTVFKDVMSTLNLPQEEITATYCDLNGQRYRNEELVYALLRTQEAFVDAHDYLCPADCWGDVGAACGPLFVALAVAAAQRGYAKGPRPLLWAGSESGYRSAVLLNLASS